MRTDEVVEQLGVAPRTLHPIISAYIQDPLYYSAFINIHLPMKRIAQNLPNPSEGYLLQDSSCVLAHISTLLSCVIIWCRHIFLFSDEPPSQRPLQAQDLLQCPPWGPLYIALSNKQSPTRWCRHEMTWLFRVRMAMKLTLEAVSWQDVESNNWTSVSSPPVYGEWHQKSWFTPSHY